MARRSGPAWLVFVGLVLCLTLPFAGCEFDNNEEAPSVDLTGSWRMTSSLNASTTCSTAFVEALAQLGYTFVPSVNLTMFQKDADLEVSVPQGMQSALLTGTVSGKNFSASSSAKQVSVGSCTVGLTVYMSSGVASADGKAFSVFSGYNIQTAGASACTPCAIVFDGLGSRIA